MKKERVKRLALWAIWAGLWVGLGLFGCEGFEQNPNLRLLKSRWKDGYDLLYPVWADNGKIYYLCRYSEGDTFPPDRRFLGAQAFMSISQDGVHDTLLLGDTVFWENPSPGRFFSLSYHKSTGHIAILQVEGPILIWDIWRDSVIDSVPNPKHLGPIVRWLPDGSGLWIRFGGFLLETVSTHFTAQVQDRDLKLTLMEPSTQRSIGPLFAQRTPRLGLE
ncbi:MAG: hypothetical protein ABIN66_09295 [candidate division WOR-3 bacterium]